MPQAPPDTSNVPPRNILAPLFTGLSIVLVSALAILSWKVAPAITVESNDATVQALYGVQANLMHIANAFHANEPLRAKEAVGAEAVTYVFTACTAARDHAENSGHQSKRYPEVRQYVEQTAQACSGMARLAQAKAFTLGDLNRYAQSESAHYIQANTVVSKARHEYEKTDAKAVEAARQREVPVLAASLQDWGTRAP